MESKGLRVNMKKTKFLISGVGLNLLQDSGEFPCAICGLTGRLVADPEFVCQRCRGVACPIDGRPVTCYPCGCGWHPTGCGSHLLLLGRHVFSWWWLRSRYCCSLLCGLGQVQKGVLNKLTMCNLENAAHAECRSAVLDCLVMKYAVKSRPS